MRRILNVAEKPSAAKQMASVLGRGGARLGFSKSKYNPVYEFKYKFNTQDVLMNFTSVAGHIVSMAFEEQYSMKHWNTAPYEHLFKSKETIGSFVETFLVAKVLKKVDPDKELLVQNLQNLAKNASAIVLWLDCDREGEAIAYEVLRVCQEVKPDIEVYRAHFSALTEKDITNAMSNLQSPDPNLADAVESRQEIDLRIGAAFTRFQTTFLKKKIPDLSSNKVISYGPCQFPTLGFVVERWKKVQNFVPEPFWFISCKHQKKDSEGNLVNVEFQWDKDHLFDKAETEKLFEKCQKKQEAVVKSIVGSEKQKFRPVPLTTVALQKLAASKLKISSHRLMEIAEKLYNRGFISYPRTETDFFSNTINVRGLLDVQRHHVEWGEYATNLLDNGGFQWPRRGKHDDKAHPPIHPVMMVRKDDPSLTNDEWRVYELVTRHFIACCSKDAVGYETVVNIEIGKEGFHAKGLVIKELNWLEIYPYEKWVGNTLPEFKEKERFIPKELKLKDSKTSPPFLLTETELIGLMDQNGIGTDATIAEHIRTIQDRRYAEKKGSFFRPTKLGEALVDAYEATGTDLWKPFLRASMEARMTEISKGNLDKEKFLNDCLSEMEEIFLKMRSKKDVILDAMTKHFKGVRLNDTDAETAAIDFDNLDLSEWKVIGGEEEGTCGNCNSKSLKILENEDGVRVVHCPVDNMVLKIPKKGEVKLKDATCPLCSFQVLEFKVGAHSKYTVCPWCYTNPPQSLTGEVEENQSLMPCFKCKNKDCNLSATWGNDNTLFGCPKCKTHSMVLRKGKNGKQFFGCKGFPYCKHTISVPDVVKDVEVIAEKCMKCGPDVRKAKITFVENAALPASVHNRLNSEEPHFCFGGCDADLQSLGYQNNLFVTPGGIKTSNKNYYPNAAGSGDVAVQQEGTSSTTTGGNLNQIKCYKCNQFGHYANKCPQGLQGAETAPLTKEEPIVEVKKSPVVKKVSVEEKACPACGQVGRHPNGSTCPSIKKKSAKAEKSEEKPVADALAKKKTNKKEK